MIPKYFALFFTILVINTAKGEETNIRSPASSEDAQPMQRRYSEATLASDYSRSVDNMLKKNFVDWLLGRREKKSQNILDTTKRQAEFQLPDLNMIRDTMDQFEVNKDFTTWLQNQNQLNSFHDDAKVKICQETIDILMAMDLCKARFS
ncbi:gastric inhibitory polypeptide [Lithobates pipiens]|uniref:gastric inhibitory polypeptide n=1 Tax=Aquarana catesbeiana TaxID=8400 RepID=UPI003CCA0A0A